MRPTVELRTHDVVEQTVTAADRRIARSRGIPRETEARREVVVIRVLEDLVDHDVFAVSDATEKIVA